jgi:ribonuclease T1
LRSRAARRFLLFGAALLALGLGLPPAAAREGRLDRASAAAGLPAIRVRDLPPEARETLSLIERSGPFTHRRDGAVFSNRERRLPPRPRGYYREYTVPTPGARDRGARRIVSGSGGERYYSPDHYRSFRHIEE